MYGFDERLNALPGRGSKMTLVRCLAASTRRRSGVVRRERFEVAEGGCETRGVWRSRSRHTTRGSVWI